MRTRLVEPWPEKLTSAFPHTTRVEVGVIGDPQKLAKVAHKVVGRPIELDEYARLLSAPDGARVAVLPASNQASILMHLRHPFYAGNGFMKLGKTGTELVLQHEATNRTNEAPPKLGTYQHALRILQAQQLFPGIVLQALGRRNALHSGAQSFAWLGYTMKLPEVLSEHLPKSSKELDATDDLARLVLAGRIEDWLEYKGAQSGIDKEKAPMMRFHTRKGSASRKVFDKLIEDLPHIEIPVYEVIPKDLPKSIGEWIKLAGMNETP